MPLYPLSIPLCQHIKDDGKQCGIPRLASSEIFVTTTSKQGKKRLEINAKQSGASGGRLTLPTLEGRQTPSSWGLSRSCGCW